MAVLIPLLIAVGILLAPGLRDNTPAVGIALLIFLALASGKWLDIRGKQAMVSWRQHERERSGQALERTN